jgi:hypothetical protein
MERRWIYAVIVVIIIKVVVAGYYYAYPLKPNNSTNLSTGSQSSQSGGNVGEVLV